MFVGDWSLREGLPFQVNRVMEILKTPVWVIQGSPKTWVLALVPTCLRGCGYYKSHRRHFSPPFGPAEFPGSGMRPTGCSHSNNRTLEVKAQRQLYPRPQTCTPEDTPSRDIRAQGFFCFRLWLPLRVGREGLPSRPQSNPRRTKGPDLSSISSYFLCVLIPWIADRSTFPKKLTHKGQCSQNKVTGALWLALLQKLRFYGPIASRPEGTERAGGNSNCMWNHSYTHYAFGPQSLPTEPSLIPPYSCLMKYTMGSTKYSHRSTGET